MTERYGYHGKILEIDLTRKLYKIIRKDDLFYRIYAGGSLMAGYFLLKDTKPGIDPFDEENLLIFSSSIVAGNKAPGLAKFSVCAKSPLSNGIGEARAEGGFGAMLKGSMYDLIIFKGISKNPVYIRIDNGKVYFENANKIWGKDTYETAKWLKMQHKDCKAAMIGPAGENKIRYSAIVTDDSTMAARTGMGAIMGSKKMKALVLSSKNNPKIYDEELVEEISEDFRKKMKQNILSMWQKEAPGFSASADLEDNDTAYIGYENYKSNLRIEDSCYQRSRYLEYYKKEKVCTGCPNDCIKILNPGDEPDDICAIHQEVTVALGPNLGIKNLKLVLKANALCNRYGIDPVSLGYTMSFVFEAYEKGLIPPQIAKKWDLGFGKEETLLPLIRSISYRNSILGNMMAEGAKRMSKELGIEDAKISLTIKGIEMVSFEPRTQTNLALGYATAPTGPRYDICEHDWDFDIKSGWEHTLDLSKSLGIFKRVPMEKNDILKVRNFKALYILWSALDALNICIFASAPTRVLSVDKISMLIHGITGYKTSSYELIRYGERRNHLLRLYNLREGLSKEDDTLPKRFFEKPIDMGRFKGHKLNIKEFKESIQLLYEMFNWDKNGIPTDGVLIDNNLEEFCKLTSKLRGEKE